MAYQQISTLLEHVTSFHHGVAEQYDRLEKNTDHPRVAMLMEYLARHERTIEKAIELYQDEIPNNVLNTWITTTEETAHLSTPNNLVTFPSQDATVDDVLELAMKLDEQVISVYEEIVQRDAPTSVTDTFENLLAMERNEEKQMVKQAARGAEL